jgi:hypothetical protein
MSLNPSSRSLSPLITVILTLSPNFYWAALYILSAYTKKKAGFASSPRVLAQSFALNLD